MDMMGLIIFLLLALLTPALAALKALYLVNQLKTWTEAQSYCRQNFIDLATIEGEDDMARVDAMVANSGQTRAWVGLYAHPKSWRWSLGNTSLYQQQDFGTWLLFYRRTIFSGQTCAYLYNYTSQTNSYSYTLIYDYSCQYGFPSICYNEPSDTYTVVTDSKSWYDAQSNCRELYTDLASITNQQQLNAIISTLTYSGSFWVGLHGEGWKWSDQSDATYATFGSLSYYGGTDRCGAAGSGRWHDTDCQTKYHFICSGPPRHSKVLKVTVKTDGSVNLNDPLVQEAIRKQMEKDLRGQGLTQQHSLSWRKQPHGHVFNKTEL